FSDLTIDSPPLSNLADFTGLLLTAEDPETAHESKSGGNSAAALHTLARTSLAPRVLRRASVWSAPAGLLALFRLNNRLSALLPIFPEFLLTAQRSKRLTMRSTLATDGRCEPPRPPPVRAGITLATIALYSTHTLVARCSRDGHALGSE